MEHQSPWGTATRPRLTRRNLLRWASLVAATSLPGCGGGSDDDPGTSAGNSGGGGVPPSDLVPGTMRAGKGVTGMAVTPAQREAAFNALNLKLAELYDATTGRAPPAPLLAWLAEQDAFQTIGYSGTRDVYAIFTDGRPLLITTSLRVDTGGVSDGPPRTASSVRRMHAAAARPRAAASALTDFEAGIPSRQFRCLNTFFDHGIDWPAGVWCRPKVSNMIDLATVGALMETFGYQPVGGHAAMSAKSPLLSVEQLKQVSGDGVFFWTTHGGMLDPGGNIIQGLMTSTSATQNMVEDVYKNEFAEGTLIYHTGALCVQPQACSAAGVERDHTRLSITPKFIKKYRWSFGEHSLVFVNACASATGPMKQAFLDAGASVYLGWASPVRIWAMCGAAMDFFSLMLGLNENAGGRPELVLPLQRPYDWGAVMDHLHAYTQAAYYLDEEDGIVELEPTLNPAVAVGFLGLRPSIYWTSFSENTSELILIGGVFGTHPGTAAIGTGIPFSCDTFEACTAFGFRAEGRVGDPVALTVNDWKSENIVLGVPRDGAGSAGIVQVDVDGRWSNGIQLTRINGHLKAVKTFNGSLKLQVNADVSFRGDFRGVRLNPIQELTYLPLVGCQLAPQASGQFLASGQYSYTEDDVTTTIDWSGHGNTGSLSSLTGAVTFTGTIAPATRAGKFIVGVMVTGISETVTISSPGQPPHATTRDIAVSIESQALSNAEPSYIELAFSPEYGAAAATQNFTTTGGSRYRSADTTISLTCGPFSAEYPPDENVGGR